MDKRNTCVMDGVLMCVVMCSSIIFGMIIGSKLQYDHMNKTLSQAGIDRLVEHEIVVDGVVKTNWVEIVYKSEEK